MVNRKFNKFIAIVLVVLLTGIVTAGVALADILWVDGDGLVPIIDGNTLSFNTVTTPVSQSKNVILAVRRQGGANVTFKNSSTATITTSFSNLSDSSILSWISASDGSITFPSNWEQEPNNTISSGVLFGVTLNIPSNITSVANGTYTGTITYTANGKAANDQELVRASSVNFSFTIAIPAPTNHTVIFVDYDEITVLKTETVTHGHSATAPTNPTRTGYTFTGWDVEFANITADLTVTAQYEINTYTVTFVDWNGTKLKEETVDHGSTATAPAAPTRTGYTFIGWNPAELSNITSDLTVTAQYVDDISPTAPSISLSTENWTNGNVTVTITDGTDEGSGVDRTEYRTKLGTSGWSEWTVYSAAFDITDEGLTIVESKTIDKDGNESAVDRKTAKIDRTNPVVTFDGSAPIVYTLNSTATVSWTASDALSGLATAASGTENLDTSSVGLKTVTVTATDIAGNSQTYTFNYRVQFDSSGILAPIKIDGSSVFKQGSTIPVKFQLNDVDGLLSDAVARNVEARIRIVELGVDSATYVVDGEIVSTAAATSGNLFRYDDVADQFIFNLGTRNLKKNHTYRVEVWIGPASAAVRYDTATFRIR